MIKYAIKKRPPISRCHSVIRIVTLQLSQAEFTILLCAFTSWMGSFVPFIPLNTSSASSGGHKNPKVLCVLILPVRGDQEPGQVAVEFWDKVRKVLMLCDIF